MLRIPVTNGCVDHLIDEHFGQRGRDEMEDLFWSRHLEQDELRQSQERDTSVVLFERQHLGGLRPTTHRFVKIAFRTEHDSVFRD